MKTLVKNALSRAGVLPAIDGVRRLPEIYRWVRDGCLGPAPPPVKRRTIAAYIKRYQISEFIETGTHLGDTLAYIARDRRIHCRSIELADDLFDKAFHRFQHWPNVDIYKGDSGSVLPLLVRSLAQPALFWLDGHYSGGLTAKGDVDTPISAELRAVLQSSVKGHVILIDDARCFCGSSGYPYLEDLLVTLRLDDQYVFEISADIIRLVPKA